MQSVTVTLQHPTPLCPSSFRSCAYARLPVVVKNNGSSCHVLAAVSLFINVHGGFEIILAWPDGPFIDALKRLIMVHLDPEESNLADLTEILSFFTQENVQRAYAAIHFDFVDYGQSYIFDTTNDECCPTTSYAVLTLLAREDLHRALGLDPAEFSVHCTCSVCTSCLYRGRSVHCCQREFKVTKQQQLVPVTGLTICVSNDPSLEDQYTHSTALVHDADIYRNLSVGGDLLFDEYTHPSIENGMASTGYLKRSADLKSHVNEHSTVILSAGGNMRSCCGKVGEQLRGHLLLEFVKNPRVIVENVVRNPPPPPPNHHHHTHTHPFPKSQLTTSLLPTAKSISPKFAVSRYIYLSPRVLFPFPIPFPLHNFSSPLISCVRRST